MLMVIFGAGASYDSAPSYPPGMGLVERPPLADQLFENREQFAGVLKQFPECHEIVPRLRHRSGNSVERELEALQAQAETHPERHRQLAAVRYYLQLMLFDCQARWEDLIKGVSNYKTLLDDINRLKKGQQVCLVTFNYDTLLESALPTVGTQIHGLRDYITGNYKIIKLHGSINWGREVDTPIENPDARDPRDTIRELIRRAGEIRIGPGYHLLSGWPAARVEKTVV
ncbi:MAG: hypothetical protein HYS14_11415, partial [Candidatus Rokubacteria bacterium]|nr:hypothetical protein [Candidatus Rokubacteria bacterium]